MRASVAMALWFAAGVLLFLGACLMIVVFLAVTPFS